MVLALAGSLAVRWENILTFQETCHPREKQTEPPNWRARCSIRLSHTMATPFKHAEQRSLRVHTT